MGDLDPECFHEQFELFRKVLKAQDFQLVLHAVGWECEMESVVSRLKVALQVEKARGGFVDLFPEPLVTFAPLSNLESSRLPTAPGLRDRKTKWLMF